VLTLQSSQSFQAAIDFAQNRIDTIIASKLDEFFEMAEYDWTPPLPANLRKRGVISGTSPSNSAFMNSRPGSRAVGGQVAQRQSTTMQWFDANTTQEPSTYLFEMITFLTAYVDSVLIMLNEEIKTRTYRMALEHVNKGLLVSFRCMPLLDDVYQNLKDFASRVGISHRTGCTETERTGVEESCG